ncbi:LysE family transporter [Anderseniella sp. Alg231-50]|uniref:LysE family transporter n=1 Tax=Anderseniella sp. Alg231-50 TaxID=1922226 RepID=UPI000D550310
MELGILVSLVGFAFATSATPGPNTLMLLASGVNYGFRKTIPHMLGIGFGFLALLLSVGFGLGEMLQRVPALYLALKVAGGAYLIYLAWRIAMSRSISEGSSESARPLSFLEAAAFQWVNPKAWAIAVVAMATYTNAANATVSIIVVAVAFFLVNLPSASIWTMFGSMLREWLSHPTRLKIFNISMAILLVVSLWPMLR